MKKNFWFKFEWGAWLGDKNLRRCSLETRGFWIECICIMEDEETSFLEGTPAELANLIGCGQDVFDRCVAELDRTKAAEIVKSQDYVKVVSRRLTKRYNLREYNRLQKQKEREKQNVNVVSNDSSKIRVLEIKSLREERREECVPALKGKQPEKITHIHASDAAEFGFPIKEFFDAFPDAVLVLPTHIGMITSEVKADKPHDREAWNLTLKLYQGNIDRAKGKYLPERVGTLLDVFRKKRKELEDQNARSNGNHKSDRNDSDVLSDSAEYLKAKHSQS